MAQLAIAAVGALALGPVGLGLTTAATGFVIGSMAYSLMAPGQKSYGPKLNDLKVTGTEYGAAIPWVTGSPRVAGQIIWASERRETATEEEQGKGDGPTYTSYTYDVDLLILLSENEISGVSRIWSNGELIYGGGAAKEGAWVDMRVYTGDEEQLPDPTYEAAVGLGNAPAYRGMGTVLIQGLQLGNSGNIPNLTFELGDSVNSETVTCIAIIDENDNDTQAGVNAKWAEFRAAYPQRRLYVLRPEGWEQYPLYRPLNAGPRFVGPQWVSRDHGVVAKRSDWYDLCNLDRLPNNSAIALFIDNSGSMFTSHVQASYDYFLQRLAARGISVVTVANELEDYITPFNRYLDIPGQSGPVGAGLRSVVDEFMQRAGYGSADFSATALSDRTVRALAVGSVSNTRSVLEALQQGYLFECSASDQILMRPRSVVPVVTIPFVDLGMAPGSGGDDEPLALTLGNDLELPAQLALSYPNMAGDYQTATEFSDRLLSGQQSTETIQTALGLLPAEAKGIVDGLLMDRVASLATATLKLPLKYAYLEPGDVVDAVNSDGRTYRLRVQSKTDAMPIIELQCVLDDVGAIDSAAVTDTGYANTETVIQPAGTLFHALDMPILRDADDAPGYYLAVAPSRVNETDKWPGAVAAQAWDGVNYLQLFTTTAHCVMGMASTVLGPWPGGPVFDESSTVTVQVSGELASSTREAMLLDESIGAMLLGSEVIRFRTAALLSAGTYLLSGLLRGQRGTEWAMGSHAAGERCVLLGNGLRRVSSQTNELGVPRQIKAVTLGRFLSSGMAQDFTDTGLALKPFSPANPRALVDGGDLVVSWQRRTRLSYQYSGPAPVVPLGEAAEAYRVRVYAGSTLLRTDMAAAASYRYTSDMQAADGVGSGSAVQFEICQLSAIAGPGYPSTVGTQTP
ncbi:phage tail protein [Comamonas sp.]|uniref:phage tail protein n=1 Tax=Comamonas sp. TaxID=34028 RepID=UPI003A939858